MSVKNSDYINAEQLRSLVPGLGIHTALKIIKDVREEMKEQNLFVPQGRPFIALTKMVLNKLGI